MPPRKRVKVQRWPCVVCKDNCDHGSIQCDACKCWVHAECDGFNSKDLPLMSGNTSYMCRMCISKDDGESYSYTNAMFRLNEAGAAGVEKLRVVATREKCLMPHMYQSFTIDRSSLRVDFRALSYLECETDIIDQQPILSRGDGNCLFNSLSIGICGNDSLSIEIRARTCVEMATNREFYMGQPYAKDFVFVCDTFDNSLITCAKLGAYSDAWIIQAASDALNREIKSVYPHVNNQRDHVADLLSRSFIPKDTKTSGEALSIMWSLMGHYVAGTSWLPNHFVPLISVVDDSASNDASTPTKPMDDIKLNINESRIPNASEQHTPSKNNESAQLNMSATSESNVNDSAEHNMSATSESAEHNMSSTSDSSEHNMSATSDSAEHNMSATSDSAEHNMSATSESAEHNMSATSDSAEHNMSATSESAEHNMSATSESSEHNMSATSESSEHNMSATSESAEHNMSSTSDSAEHKKTSETNVPKPNIPGLNPLPESGNFLKIDELFDLWASEEPCVERVPKGVKENVFTLFNNSDNMSKIQSKKAPQFWDDCGAWDYRKARKVKSTFLLTQEESKPHGLNYVVVKEGIVYKEIRVKGKKQLHKLEPQPSLSRIVTVNRHYTALKRDTTYKKRVSWVENVPSGFNCRNDIAVIEYIGNYDNSETPHGNSKINTQRYERTHPDVINKIKTNVEHQKPTDAYIKLTDPALDESINFPRDLKQCQNLKANTLNEGNKGHKSNNVADEIMNVIRMLNANHPFVQEMIHSRGNNNLPIIVCYTDDQLEDFKSFLSSKSGVVGVDRTFSLGKCFVTTTVYKSHKLNRKGTGEPPILLGPLMLHWDGRQRNYFRFFSHIKGELGCEIKNIELLLGTDDERAMTNAIDMAMPGATRKLCTKHIKDNIIRQTTDKIPKTTKERKEIVNLIFNSEGVATANDSAVFDARNAILKDTLRENHSDFLVYYEKHVQTKIADHVVSGDDQLWTNNNTESINNRLKLKINWDPKKYDH